MGYFRQMCGSFRQNSCVLPVGGGDGSGLWELLFLRAALVKVTLESKSPPEFIDSGGLL